jgi:peptidyl-prolyl cis-trans isomerase B (cyclophilin B)
LEGKCRLPGEYKPESSENYIKGVQAMSKNPIVTIEMEKGGIIKAELYPEIAPITCENFVKLVRQGFYNGLIFHRVIKDFMIQGGCPLGTGTGNPGWSIKGEFAQNGVQNDLKHTEGVLSMARSADPNSAGSQFFIMTSVSPHLDGAYAGFGKVIEGMEVVREIENCRTPRTELMAGKSQYEIKDDDGQNVMVHQGNVDKPLGTWRIKAMTVEE